MQKKCEFHQKKIEFLRVDVSRKGFEMDDKKIMDIVQWQWPMMVCGVREFISFVNFYRRWIPGFSDVAKPLHALFQKDHKWDWTENEQTAFKVLKWQVSQAPVLIHANPEKMFRMETNASNYAYGAVLSQKQTNGQHHPIGYMSKSMNPAERNYGIPDKEALAIVKGLQNWRHWLERTRLLVQILTDHKNLEYFLRPRILNWHQMHWLEMLTHYNYEIHYCPGDKNCAANALSRRAELHPPDGEDNIPQCLIPEAKFTELAACEAEMTDSDWVDLTDIILAALAFSDEHLLSDARRISRDWEDKPEGLVWDDGLGRKDRRIWIPEDEGLWKKVMRLYHDSLVTGHLGTLGTLELVLRSYWRRNLPNYVKRYVQGCHTCRRAKHRNQWEHGKLQPIPAPNGPWQWIQSDFVGELPKSDGFNAIYVVSNRLTKMAHFIPMTTDISTPDLMKLHIRHVWKLHGIPLVHGTDCSSTFTANFTKSIYKDLGIEPHFSTAYHPQTQGQVKNNNKWMETYLRMFCSH
jgi:transposase InsO family protein